VGITSLAVMEIGVPLHQLSECYVRRALGSDRMNIHGISTFKTAKISADMPSF
jgi:hypothetical protein